MVFLDVVKSIVELKIKFCGFEKILLLFDYQDTFRFVIFKRYKTLKIAKVRHVSVSSMIWPNFIP